MADINLKPLGDNVLIRPLSEDEAGKKSDSGIIIPDTVSSEKEEGKKGIIVALGPGKWNEDGDKRLPMGVEVGQRVLFQSWQDKVKIEDEEYWVVSESDIKLVIS